MDEPRASLRVQALRKRLTGHPNADRLYEYATLLDGWIHEWARYASRAGLRDDERMRAVNMLASMRRDFNALLAEVDAHSPNVGPSSASFGTALDSLGPDERFALAQILGLQYEAKYRDLFEVKAAEYIEQDALWNSITEEAGLVEAPWLPADSRQSAVILTYSGSLLLISAPIENKLNVHPMIEMSIVSGVSQAAAYALVVLAEDIRPKSNEPEVRANVERELSALLAEVNATLADYEKLQMLVIANEAWSIENGYLTPTMKIKRSRIEAAVESQVETWYQKSGSVFWA